MQAMKESVAGMPMILTVPQLQHATYLSVGAHGVAALVVHARTSKIHYFDSRCRKLVDSDCGHDSPNCGRSRTPGQ